MGSAKDAMTPTTPKAKNAFERFLGRKNPKSDTKKSTEETVADSLADCESNLVVLIKGKESDLKNEKGQENYNAIQLSRLKAMHFHIEAAIAVAADYGTQTKN